MQSEEELTGGNMSSVTRIGNVVHRSAGPWSLQVQRYLAHLHASGIHEVPVPLGFDATGREMVSFIPGIVGLDPLPAWLRADSALISAARLLRRIHDASVPVTPDWLDGWQASIRYPVEVICHGDFAPYNCVYDHNARVIGVIDFDYAHPGPRQWDIAYALYRFVPFMAPGNPDSFGDLVEQCRRARLFLDTYGLDHRLNMVQTLIARVASMAQFLQDGADRGDTRHLANIAAGHLKIYLDDVAYLNANRQYLQSELEK